MMMDELKSSSDNEPEIYDVKVGECKRHQQAKKEVKEKEVRECQQREEAECQPREEAATVWRQEEADHQVWGSARQKKRGRLSCTGKQQSRR